MILLHHKYVFLFRSKLDGSYFLTIKKIAPGEQNDPGCMHLCDSSSGSLLTCNQLKDTHLRTSI